MEIFNSIIKFIPIFYLIIGFVSGLYEDQINKYDWKKEYIGKPHDVLYDNTVSTSKNVYMITEKNVIASLSSKNGLINWRQVLDERLIKILRYGDALATVSSSGVLRLWDSASGLLKWDINLNANVDEDVVFEFVDASIIELDYTEGDVLIILSKSGVYAVTPSRVQSGAKAKPKVEFVKFDSSLDGFGKLLLDSESKEICVLDIVEGSSIATKFYDVKTLESTNEEIIQTPWLDTLKAVTITENKQLIYAGKAMESLYVIDLKKGVETSKISLAELEITSGIVSLTAMNECDFSSIGIDFFAILENGNVVHMRHYENAAIKVIATKKSSVKSQTLQVSVKKVGRESYYFIIREERESLKITGSSVRSGEEDSSLLLDFKLLSDVGSIEKIFVNMFLKKSSPVGYRVMLTTEDDCVMMVTLPTRLSWRRYEALASVTSAELLDLPLSDIEAGIEVEFEKAESLSVFAMFTNRIKSQIGQLKAFTKHFTKAIKEGTLFEKNTKDPLVQDESMTRDPFSLHKMLVLVTSCGKIFGMDSLSGKTVWSFYSPDLKDKNLKLFIQRTAAHFPNPPSALLLATEKSGSSRTTLTVAFNPITGKISESEKLNKYEILQASLLPFVDTSHMRSLLILDKDLDVHLLPDTPATRKKLEEVRSSIYLFNVDDNSNKITGYWMQKGMKMLETFVIQIPHDQKILEIKGKDLHEKIDAVGRPLSDRSVIYKYLNPNLVLVLTDTKDPSDMSPTLTMYLIDAVAGNIVYYATHKKATGPVHAVHSENWVIYSYWNVKARRTEIASYELYEGKVRRNDTVFSSFDNVPGVPNVVSQSYILGGTVSAMGVSRTEKGLTSRQILLGLGRGSVLGLPRRLFDPRRPLRPQPSDREEGLIPYVPEIQVVPLMLISYNKTVQRISNIYTCPSALESTSIVLVTGLDLFFTRTQPSNMFDVLKEDFEYLLIIAVLSGMFIAAVVTRKLAQNKKLNKAWR